MDKVKKYNLSSDIKDNVCEICGEQAMNGQLDKTNNIRYACLKLDHIKQVFNKIRKE